MVINPQNSDIKRVTARQFCTDAISRGEPLAWFEQLYASADGNPTSIPWADLEPNPNLVTWHQDSGFNVSGKQCLKVGCGLGDDCEYLNAAGGIVTGFDISPTAIEWCQRRFKQSAVQYVVHDLFNTPQSWISQYNFVLESYTIQVLPPDLRSQATAAIANFVADDGLLLVICRARNESSPLEQMPWPLTQQELLAFGEKGLSLIKLEEFQDNESPPINRFRAAFKRTETIAKPMFASPTP